MTCLSKEKKGLIFAADFIDEKSCLNCIQEIVDFIDAVKIGNLLTLSVGLNIVQKIKKMTDLPVIGDFKIMDIPPIAISIIKQGIEAGLDGFMVCGVCGYEVLQDCIEMAKDKMIFVFTEFTHSTGLINRELSNYVAKIAKDQKAYGIQAPATKSLRIIELRQIIGDELQIISCGVGEQGVEYGDAIKCGADYEIVGRSIYLSDNPRLEAQKAKSKICEITTGKIIVMAEYSQNEFPAL